MLQAGLEILDRDGLGLGADSISYAKVFAHLDDQYSIRVTRGSVHERIWASHHDFRREILADAVRYLPRRFPTATGITNSTAPDSDPGETRAAVFSRRAGAKLFTEALHSPVFGQLQSAKAIASRYNDLDAVESLHGVFNQRTEDILAIRQTRFPHLVAYLGLKPRTELGLTDQQTAVLFHTISAALFVGGHLNYHAGTLDIAKPIDYLGRPADAAEPWLVPSVGIKSLYDFLYQPDLGAAPEPTESPAPPPAPLPTDTPPRIGSVDPKARRTRQELKQLVLTAGVELFLRDGLDLKPESLAYGAVFAHIKQTRGITLYRTSVHQRIWPSHDQFRYDVLANAILTDRESNPRVLELLDTPPPTVSPGGATLRYQAVLDVIRRATQAQVDFVGHSPNHERRQLIKAALLHQTSAAGTEPLRSAIAEIDRVRIDQYRSAMDDQIRAHGFQVRPQLKISESRALDLIAVLAMTTITGALFDHRAGIKAATRTTPLPRLDAPTRTDDWTPTGISIRAYFHQLFHQTQPDND